MHVYTKSFHFFQINAADVTDGDSFVTYLKVSTTAVPFEVRFLDEQRNFLLKLVATQKRKKDKKLKLYQARMLDKNMVECGYM